MKFGLPENTNSRINETFKQHPEVSEALIYGSRAKGNFQPGSDIDLTLKGDNLNDTILLKIKSELDELNTPCLFDVSLFENLHSPELEAHIKRVGAVFYKKI